LYVFEKTLKKMKTLHILAICLLTINLYSQSYKIEPQTEKKPAGFCKTPPLITLASYDETPEIESMRTEAHDSIPGKSFSQLGSCRTFTDPVLQRRSGWRQSPPLITNFDGLGALDNSCTNPDTEGDVGLNHYMQMIKRSFAIWDKQGNLLYGPVSNKTLWSTLPGPWLDHWFTDPIVVYDHLTDRWLASNMVYEIQGTYLFWEVIAVSATPDPLGEWYCWAYQFDGMPDYPKFGVWQNEYVMTVNNVDISLPELPFTGVSIWAFNKDDLMVGNPEPAIISFLVENVENDYYKSPSGFLPADLDGVAPEPGSPHILVYVKDDAWGFDVDHLSLWQLYTDWENPGNSSLSELVQLEVEPFTTNLSNYAFIQQPNTTTTLSTLADRLMFRLQYRNFGDYQAMVTNHTITTTSDTHAGIRWYELRNYGDGWQIYQQSTFDPDADNRWMASAALDNRGNLALGYSVSGLETSPSIRITGRADADPPGLLSLEEMEVVTGNGSQEQNYRWGDYSCMSIDPSDDQTFWYTQMYMPTTGPLEWETKICSFKLAQELNFNVDTLVFHTADECIIGLPLILKNNSYDTVTINNIEPEGYNQGFYWTVENLPVFFPYELLPDDSLALNVKVAIPVQQGFDGFLFDTLTIVANTTYHYNITLAVNEGLISEVKNPAVDEFDIKVRPNPFTSEITIDFFLSDHGKVGFTFMNNDGKTIVCLSQKYKRGQNSFIWNPGNIPSGNYYCRISAGNKSRIFKVVKY